MHVQQREKAVGLPTCLSFIPFRMQPLRYYVGLDISKDLLQICLLVIDTNGRVAVKGSTKVANKPAAFAQLEPWVSKHCKTDSLPLRYVMESTGVYHEAIAWHLYQKDQAVCILLPNKAKHYLKSLGYKSKNDKIDAQGLARMGVEQQLTLWKPLSKNLYTLRLLTRQHQRFQEWKTQGRNQQHALEYSAVGNDFLTKQNAKLLAVYDQQLEALEQAIQNLIQKDAILKAQVERLTAIKGLALLSVAVLIAETNGLEGFANQPVRPLGLWAGTIPGFGSLPVVNQSGTHYRAAEESDLSTDSVPTLFKLPWLGRLAAAIENRQGRLSG